MCWVEQNLRVAVKAVTKIIFIKASLVFTDEVSKHLGVLNHHIGIYHLSNNQNTVITSASIICPTIKILSSHRHLSFVQQSKYCDPIGIYHLSNNQNTVITSAPIICPTIKILSSHRHLSSVQQSKYCKIRKFHVVQSSYKFNFLRFVHS